MQGIWGSPFRLYLTLSQTFGGQKVYGSRRNGTAFLMRSLSCNASAKTCISVCVCVVQRESRDLRRPPNGLDSSFWLVVKQRRPNLESSTSRVTSRDILCIRVAAVCSRFMPIWTITAIPDLSAIYRARNVVTKFGYLPIEIELPPQSPGSARVTVMKIPRNSLSTQES